MLLLSTLSLLLTTTISTSASKSDVDIFPLSTTIPALTPTTKYTHPIIEPRSPNKSTFPAIEALQYCSCNHSTSSTLALTTKSHVSSSLAKAHNTANSNVQLSTSSYLSWVTSATPSALSHPTPTKPSIQVTPYPHPTTTRAAAADWNNVVGSSAPIDQGTKTVKPETLPKPVHTILWQPSKSHAQKATNIPKIFLNFLWAHSVLAAHFLPRASPILIPSHVSSTLSPSSVPSSHTSEHALTCPAPHQPCGTNTCFDPKVHWCCPDKMHVCNTGDVCAEEKRSSGEMVYGCGPPDARDGLDPRIYTAVVRRELGGGTTTLTSTSTTMVSTTVARETSMARTSALPRDSAGRRVGVLWIVKVVGLLVEGVRAVAVRFPRYVDCCGDVCCGRGEVCVKSSGGPKCWPQAGYEGARGFTQLAELPADGFKVSTTRVS
jgi:hypothetical protein